MHIINENRGSRRASLRLGLVAILTASLSGCGSSRPTMLEASSPVFQGLDQAIVQEVLASPLAARNMSYGIESDLDRDTLLQGMVRWYTECRIGYNAYVSWRKTGKAPGRLIFPAPTHPVDPNDKEWKLRQRTMEKAAESGDPEELRELLSGESGCDAPVKPGDTSGKTISQALAVPL